MTTTGDPWVVLEAISLPTGGVRVTLSPAPAQRLVVMVTRAANNPAGITAACRAAYDRWAELKGAL